MSMEAQSLFFTESVIDVVSFSSRFLCRKRLVTTYKGGRYTRALQFARMIIVLCFVSFLPTDTNLFAAVYKTKNFTVHANDVDFARQVGEIAENYRVELARLWLGYTLPPWSRPCDITVKTGSDVASAGETVFSFSNGEVYDWKMTVQGKPERILDSVLPHEVTHTIIASYLRSPAPRWLDEGMATAVEAETERTHYRKMTATFLHTKRGIAFDDMTSMKDYPSDLTPFYSQSFSVCEYLILVGGHRRLAKFAKACVESKNLNAELKKFYGCDSLSVLQYEWNSWIREWDLANQPELLPTTRRLPDVEAETPKEIALARNTNMSVGQSSTNWSDSARVETPNSNITTIARGQSRATDSGGFFRNLTQPFSSRNTGADPRHSKSTSSLNGVTKFSHPQATQSSEGTALLRMTESALSNGAGSVVRPQSPSPVYNRPFGKTAYPYENERIKR